MSGDAGPGFDQACGRCGGPIREGAAFCGACGEAAPEAWIAPRASGVPFGLESLFDWAWTRSYWKSYLVGLLAGALHVLIWRFAFKGDGVFWIVTAVALLLWDWPLFLVVLTRSRHRSSPSPLSRFRPFGFRPVRGFLHGFETAMFLLLGIVIRAFASQ